MGRQSEQREFDEEIGVGEMIVGGGLEWAAFGVAEAGRLNEATAGESQDEAETSKIVDEVWLVNGEV
jgi:hypothetical protein